MTQTKCAVCEIPVEAPDGSEGGQFCEEHFLAMRERVSKRMNKHATTRAQRRAQDRQKLKVRRLW
jgi:hypothetical protein